MTRDELNAIFDKLLAEKNNRAVSSLGHGTHECFDLIVEFTNRLGIPHYTTNPSPFPYQNAKQIYSDFGQVQALWFDRIENTPDAVPIKGDILVWNGSYNGLFGSGPGHTALDAGQSDKNSVVAFSQNDPLGTYAHLVRYTYKNVSGWLRPKVTNSQPPMNDRRDYWFDRISTVTFKKPHEQVTDADVEKFVSEYPGQLKRSGVLDGVARQLGYQGDTNQLTVDDVMLLIRKSYDQSSTRKRAIEDCIAALKRVT